MLHPIEEHQMIIRCRTLWLVISHSLSKVKKYVHPDLENPPSSYCCEQLNHGKSQCV